MATDPWRPRPRPHLRFRHTAYVAEQWGRRWITIDTSRVALALARARVMGARYPYYLLADSRDGQIKEGELTGKVPSEAPTYNDIRQASCTSAFPTSPSSPSPTTPKSTSSGRSTSRRSGWRKALRDKTVEVTTVASGRT